MSQGSKLAIALVDPDAVGGLEIIADINVDRTVVIDVSHLYRQAKFPRFGHGLTRFIQKGWATPGDRLKETPALVDPELIGFP